MTESYYAAVQDFRRARRRAALEQIMARITGKSADLLAYDEVRSKLRAAGQSRRGLQEIPLDAIVGSVGRYNDFTRSFLPKEDSSEMRWARVRRAMTGLAGLPPIEVYKIGEAYFVLDGNHRVSVARRLGATYIEAYVTEVHTRVPLSPDDQPDDLILKAEYAEFLEHTRLDQTRPQADLRVTVPGQYRILEEHIQVHRYFMGLEQQREIPYEEAAAHWYDTVYLPIVDIIRSQDLLRDFPDRTETDLYLWLAEHRGELEQALGWEIEPALVAADLAAQAQGGAKRVVTKLIEAVTPDELESGPEPGQWRAERLAVRRDDRLFADLLVAINGEENGWCALEQAVAIAHREGSRLLGLHVVPSEERREDEAAKAVQAEFDRRCAEAGVRGKLVIAAGKVPHTICQRSRWADLVVLSLNYPPAPQLLARLSSGFSTLLQRCPRPVLAVPGEVSAFRQALLAYDGSPKADEALFVATYLAGKWQIPLTVITVLEGEQVTSQVLARAQSYLEKHGVHPALVEAQGETATAILRTARERQCDLILMGSYGHSPLVEAMLGSTVDQVLRESRTPLLICR
ncbi:MAG: universal stress protein [Anaerolineae bacterium]|nr:universal stress protein [Anaerolineae bacterium]